MYKDFYKTCKAPVCSIPTGAPLPTTEMDDLIFAPDKNTGFPKSDVGFRLSHSANPEIREYIQRNLSARQVTQVGFEPDAQGSSLDDSKNANLALDMCKSAFETREQYLTRISDGLKEFLKKSKSKKS